MMLFIIVVTLVLAVDWRDLFDARPPMKKWPASHGFVDDKPTRWTGRRGIPVEIKEFK